ncbi:MAG: POTRA domain-containing protein [Myxococcales bacterium]
MKRIVAVLLVLSSAAAARPPMRAGGSAVAQASAGEAVHVGEIAFEGADASGLPSLVGIREGAVLEARMVRDAVRALHATARFAQVAAYTEPLPEQKLQPGWTRGVRLVFVVSPVRKLVALSFTGRAALPETVLAQTANLQVNSEYQESLVQRASDSIQAVYYQIGYRSARVRPTPKPLGEGVALDLHIDEGAPTRVAAVRFAGSPGLSFEELSLGFRVHPGDVLNLAALDEGTRGLRDRYRHAGRLRARVGTPIIEDETDGRALVVVPVEAGPLVRFHIRGNRRYPDSLLVQQLGTSGEEEPLDAQAAQEMAGRLRRFYVSQGFLRARIAERELPGRDGAAEIVFTVDEGRQVRVERIRFTGNSGIPTSELRDRLVQQLRDGINTDPATGADPYVADTVGIAGTQVASRRPRVRVEPETVFEPVLYARALKQIEDLYKSQGYLSVRAGPPRPERIDGDDYRLSVTIPIAEGERTVVSRVSVEGASEVARHEIDSAITLKPGRPFSYLAAEEGRAALTQIFTRRGHLYARVEDDEIFGENAEPGKELSNVEVRYKIQPGPVVKVGYVEVVGQRRTQEALIRDLVDVKPGDVLTPDVIDRGQQALLRTGLFFSATLTPRNPEVPEAEKTLQVQLRERPTKDFQATMGFSLEDGPRATAQWSQGNLWGRALTFTAAAKANFPFLRYRVAQCPPGATDSSQCTERFDPPADPLERILDLGISAPRLYPLTDALRGGIDLIHQRAVRPSYQLTKYAGQASVDTARRRPFSAGLVYELGYQVFAKGDQTTEDAIAGIDKGLRRLPEGEMIFGSLRPTVSLDLRDDPARPRSGFFAQLSGDYLRAFAISDIPADLIKIQGLVAGYLPLPGLSSLVLSARAGRITQLTSKSTTPGDRRFYLGGATSLRGFHEDAVQPQDLVDQLHREVANCQSFLSAVACSQEAVLLQAGAVSSGGDQFLSIGAELRVPLAQSLELALFYDAGNLWSVPRSFFSDLVLRDAIGFGLRWLTPIGRLAIDIGINLNPDQLFGEPKLGPYFSIDPL